MAVVYCEYHDTYIDLDHNCEHFVGSDMECEEQLREKLAGELCINCNGSGEGYVDGSKCSVCKGSGCEYSKEGIDHVIEEMI